MSGVAGQPIRVSDVMLKAGNTFAGTVSAPNPLYLTRQNQAAEGGEIMLEASANGGLYAAIDVAYDVFRIHSNGGSRFELNMSSGKLKNIGGHNDYAERLPSSITTPGYCVVDIGKDELQLSTERLQSNAYIISDTFGATIGESTNVPVALCGRVKAYPFQSKEKYSIGDCVCSAPEGKVDIMTRQEIQEYPDRIIGIVSEIIPDEERIWIRVR